MQRITTIAATIALSALILTACGGEDDSTSETSATQESSESEPDTEDAEDAESAEPEAGARQEYGEFSYALPEGWKDATRMVEDPIVSAALDSKDSDGFADNVNVVHLSPAPEPDLDSLEKLAAAELEAAGATKIVTLERYDVDGAAGIRQTAVLTQQGQTYRVEQYNAIRDGDSYVLTFSHNVDTPNEERREDIDPILASFAWAS